jgi:hypothetical protein
MTRAAFDAPASGRARHRWHLLADAPSAGAWSCPDPAAFTGGREEKQRRAIEVRDAIADRIAAWLAALRASRYAAASNPRDEAA